MDDWPLRKIRIDNPFSWESHRGGWKYIVDIIVSEFHTPRGTLFLSAVEDAMLSKQAIAEDWVGFIHQVPTHHYQKFPDLERTLKSETWEQSKKHCKGLFTLSKYLKNYLDDQGLGIPVDYIPYAIDFEFKTFDYDKFLLHPKKIIFAGEYLRNFQSFFDLKADSYQKILLESKSSKKTTPPPESTVTILNRLSDADYDQILSESIVFLNLFDAPANTLVVECLGRNTPILVNKLPGVVEYLGEDYPFYYDSLDDAANKLGNIALIENTWRFLIASENKLKITPKYFITALHNSSIYQNLPTPD